MKNHSINLFTIGFAIFSMLFGAGNLIYPLQVGITAGSNSVFGLVGFLLAAVLLPFTGLIAMILFDGNYHAFFNRLGTRTGQTLLFICFMIAGPVIAIPRIVTLSHTMITPFITFGPLQTITPTSSFIFALFFLGVTFLATYRPRKIVEIIGNVISPILLISLGVIIIKGLITAKEAVTSTMPPFLTFTTNFIRGYETLDLLGTIFFASIIINMLKEKVKGENKHKKIVLACIRGGIIGISMLSIVYVGMTIIGVFHGHNPGDMNAGQLFSTISFQILGSYGAAIIATAVLMACLSTSIALSACIGSYIQTTLLHNRVSYITALIGVLVASIPLSTYGLSTVLQLTGGPLVYVGYPVIIALTFCNLLYKTTNFKPVVTPVVLTFVAALISYMW